MRLQVSGSAPQLLVVRPERRPTVACDEARCVEAAARPKVSHPHESARNAGRRAPAHWCGCVPMRVGAVHARALTCLYAACMRARIDATCASRERDTDAIRSRAHRAMSLLRIKMGSCTRAFMPVIKTRSFSPPGVLLPAQKGGHKPSVRVAGESALRHRLLCLCAVLLATSRCAQPGTCDATWNADSGRQQQRRCAHAARPWGPRRHRASSPRGHRIKEDGLCSVTNSRTDDLLVPDTGGRETFLKGVRRC